MKLNFNCDCSSCSYVIESWCFGKSMISPVDVIASRWFCQSMILPVDVLEVDVLVVDVLELDVLGAPQKIYAC